MHRRAAALSADCEGKLFLLGRKVGMTQVADANGRAVPVTLVEAGPCRVLRIKSLQSDGYHALQIGFEEKPRRLASRGERGQVAELDRSPFSQKNKKPAGSKVGGEPSRVVREIRFQVEPTGHELGSVLTVGLFDGKKFVDVIGTTKGRGFAGAMKRHNFHGQRATHGVKKCHRALGSVGQNTYPGRVHPGQKMAGRLGVDRVTVRNLKLFSIDKDKNLLLIRGAIPGPNGGLVMVRFPKEPPRSQV